jgi:opacity protein-like surface antigen
MRSKAILLASVAGATLLVAQPAFAEGFYFSTSGGANFVNDPHDATFTTRVGTYDAHFNFDTGFVLTTAIGLELDRWLHGLKAELEASYRRNKIDGRWEFTSSGSPFVINDAALSSGDVTGHASTFALMANTWYEFDIGSRFKPYFGGGIGWAHTQFDGALGENRLITALDVNPFGGFSVSNSGFAYQLGAGITSQIMPGVSLGLGYRYFDGPDTDIFFSGKLIGSGVSAAASNSNELKFNNVNHSVALSLTVDID